MEFFKKLSVADLNVTNLQHLLTIQNLPALCASIDTVISDRGNEGEIYCLWGEFNLRRDEIREGIRFSLLNCPHALAWTVTYDEAHQYLTIHCTIDETEQEKEFVDSIEAFATDWSQGITKALR